MRSRQHRRTKVELEHWAMQSQHMKQNTSTHSTKKRIVLDPQSITTLKKDIVHETLFAQLRPQVQIWLKLRMLISTLQPWNQKHTRTNMSVTPNPGQHYLWFATPYCNPTPRLQVPQNTTKLFTLQTLGLQPWKQVDSSVFFLKPKMAAGVITQFHCLTVPRTVQTRKKCHSKRFLQVNRLHFLRKEVAIRTFGEANRIPQWMLVQIPRKVQNTN